MKVSIIIPTFNEAEVIGDCLQSLLKQTYQDLEIIIVDDGSNDNSKLKIQNSKLDFEYQNFLFLEQEHKGAGAARNLGAKYAKGEILVFVDADMTFDKDFVKKLVDPIIKGKSKGTFSKEEYVSNWENIWAKCWSINEGWAEKRRHPKNYANKQKVFRAILRKEFIKVNGFTPGGYNDDWSLSDKLGYLATEAKGARFYHKNPSSISEIFQHAKWVGKREYKLGFFGKIFAIFRSLLPFSILIGFYKFILTGEPLFVIFKIIYDFSLFIGILELILLGKKAK